MNFSLVISMLPLMYTSNTKLFSHKSFEGALLRVPFQQCSEFIRNSRVLQTYVHAPFNVLQETSTLQPQNLYFGTGLSVLRARFFASLFSSPSELSVDQTSRAPVALSNQFSPGSTNLTIRFCKFLLFWLIFFQWFDRYILFERNFFSDILKWCKCNRYYWHPVTFFTCFAR